MGVVKEFTLPDLGEGLPDGELVKWTVAVGDTVKVNDIIAEVETVKAAVELPTPYSGVVTALLAKEGDTVPVGAPIIAIDTDPSVTAEDEAPAANDAEDHDVPGEVAPERPLVGYGAREEKALRRRPRANGTVLAKPPVRKLAKDLGVDLSTVTPSGPDGRVTREDVEAAAQGARAATPVGYGAARGAETRVPVRGVRRRTAEAMVDSAFTAPHVSLFKTVDMTATMELRERVAARREFAGLKVSPLLFVAKAVILAAAKTPEINASWHETGDGAESGAEIVLHAGMNLGIAAATERGLIVPNIKDAHTLSLRELAEAITDLTETARAGRTSPADLVGGTFTITNIGVFGVDTGTPILNPGESGILAFGAVERRPWVVGSGGDERLEPRWVSQLAVSFDHRVVDGQQGATFLRDVADILADPALALL